MREFRAIQNLRSNASLKSVAQAARIEADRADAIRIEHNDTVAKLDWYERTRQGVSRRGRDLYVEFKNLDLIAEHLERLTHYSS